MQVYINRRVVTGPWGGGNMFVKAYHQLGEQGDVAVLRDKSLSFSPDVVLLVGLEDEGIDKGVESMIAYKWSYNANVKLVLRVNENDARKGTSHIDRALVTASQFMDGTIFVSKWLQDHFNTKGWACKNQAVILNGVDREVFAPQPKLNNGKLNIVAHHWSDNPMKGADIYENIDRLVGEHPDRFAFTYIGRHRCAFRHTRVVKPLLGKALGEELGKHDIYVSASRFDPGPNHVLEALSCGLPTYVHKDGGGCVEFAGSSGVYASWDDLRTILEAATQPDINQSFLRSNSNHIDLTDWQTCVTEYNRFLEATWRRNESDSQSC